MGRKARQLFSTPDMTIENRLTGFYTFRIARKEVLCYNGT